MPGPSDFTSFSDYLGLNQEAGAGMRAAADASYSGPDASALDRMGQQQFAASRRVGLGRESQADYDASGESLRKGVASYQNFLKGMSDPAHRRAVMENVYGKGAVSALDVSVSGGGASNGGEQAGNDVGANADRWRSMGDSRISEYARGNAMFQKYNAEDKARMAAAAAARQGSIDSAKRAAHSRAVDRFGKFIAPNLSKQGQPPGAFQIGDGIQYNPNNPRQHDDMGKRFDAMYGGDDTQTRANYEQWKAQQIKEGNSGTGDY